MIVSIIVPIYNAEKYLQRCIDSILAQTYSNIEIILVNDGSPDGSLKICKKNAGFDDRIIVINQENRGLGGARNSGLKIARGEYISFIDADDSIDAQMVTDFVKIAVENKPNVICSNYLAFETGNIKYSIIKNDLKYGAVLDREEIKKYFLQPYYGGKMGIIPSACTKLYNIDFLRKNNIYFDENLKRAQDYWFNFYVFKMSNSVFVTDKAYYHYYNNGGSMIRTYRNNVYEMYLSNRKKLLDENIELNLNVNWSVLNLRFVDDANEYILLCFKSNGFLSSYSIVMKIIKNNILQETYKLIKPTRPHIKIIKLLMIVKAYFVIYCLYFIWSTKLKNI
jgi:glycosyltransferase involved in cell wall biosynthesis